MDHHALLTLWLLGIGMAVKGRRRTRSRRGRVCGLRRRRRVTQKGAAVTALPTFSVSWPHSGVTATEEGVAATQAATASQPVVEWGGCRGSDSPAALYTLIVWDPDAPSAGSSYLHWLVLNCTGSTPATGETVMSWVPPTPPAGSGTHRYIFGLYKQAARLSVRVDKRPQFNPDSFAELHGLTYCDTKRVTVSAGNMA
jgi:hypothetical protein